MRPDPAPLEVPQPQLLLQALYEPRLLPQLLRLQVRLPTHPRRVALLLGLGLAQLVVHVLYQPRVGVAQVHDLLTGLPHLSLQVACLH